jgi:uncharacterized protein involved in exopolysaccharide biosynthesis/Mrp family chromosome partitioning ATPase
MAVASSARFPRIRFDALVAGARRRLPLFAVVFLAILAAAAAYTFTRTAQYEAVARVLVEPRTRNVTPNPEALGGLPQKDSDVVDTEVEVLESANLAERVAISLNLTADPEFGGGSVAGTIANLRGALNIRRAGETYLIDVAAEAKDPRRAAAIANAFAENYIVLQTETRRAATLFATNLLRQRVDAMAAEVRSTDAAVQQYKIANNLMSVSGATLGEETAATLDQDLARAQAQEAEARARLASLSRSGGTLDVANAQASLGALRAEQARATQALSEAAERYGERHPTYQAALVRAREIERSIAAETGRARSAAAAERQQQINQARAEAEAAANRRASLSASAARTRGALARNTRAEVTLAELQRQADAVRATYQAYLNRLQENQTQLGTEQADARVVARAAPPLRPSSPNHPMNLALGGMLAIAGGLAAVVLAAALDPRLSTPTDVEAEFDIDALPSIATLKSIDKEGAASAIHPVAYILQEPLSAFAEQYRNLQAAIVGPGVEVVAFTSALPGEGKSTTSLAVATVAALSGIRTIIVDCDVRHRSMSRYVNPEQTIGLTQVLAGECSWNSAVHVDPRSGLHHILMTNAPTSLRDFFGGKNMQDLIAELRRSYSLVVLDTAPVLPIADTRHLARLADATAVLVRWRDTPRKAVEAALSIISSAGAQVTGIALTLVDLRRQAAEGFGDPAFYYRKYGSYYDSRSGDGSAAGDAAPRATT